MKKQTTVPIIKRVIMEHEGLYYQAMPVQEYKDLYPGKWKCGKCTLGVIWPIIGLYDAPECRVCGAFVRDIRYNDLWHGSMFEDKVFRYSYAPVSKLSRTAPPRDVDKETGNENANTGKTGRKKSKP